MNSGLKRAISAALEAHRDQISSQLEGVLRVHALDNVGILTAPRRSPEVAEQINEMWLDFLNNSATTSEIEQRVAKLVDQGLVYTTASKAMQTLKQSVLEYIDESVELKAAGVTKLDLFTTFDQFATLLLNQVAVRRELFTAREGEAYQASLYKNLQLRLQSEQALSKRLARRQERLRAVFQIESAIAELTDEYKLLQKAVQLILTHLDLGASAIFQISPDGQLVTARSLAGHPPTPITLNLPQPLKAGSPFEQAMQQEQVVVAPLFAEEGPLKTEIIVALGGANQPVFAFLTLWSKEDDLEEADLEFIRPLAIILTAGWQNLRLLAQTENRAMREQTIRQITEKMQTATNLEALVKLTAEALNTHFLADYTLIELGPDNFAAGATEAAGVTEGNGYQD